MRKLKEFTPEQRLEIYNLLVEHLRIRRKEHLWAFMCNIMTNLHFRESLSFKCYSIHLKQLPELAALAPRGVDILDCDPWYECTRFEVRIRKVKKAIEQLKINHPHLSNQ